MLKTITLRIEDELHIQFKLKMVREEKTMQDRIIELIEKDLQENYNPEKK